MEALVRARAAAPMGVDCADHLARGLREGLLSSVLFATITHRSGGYVKMAERSKRSIEEYYAEYPEHERLSSGSGKLEFERTKLIVQRFLSPPPAVVIDVGWERARIPFGYLVWDTKRILSSPQFDSLRFARSEYRKIQGREGHGRRAWEMRARFSLGVLRVM
jgi:hypothetical protein